MRLIAFTTLWVLLISSVLTTPRAKDGIGKVVRVIDGDTLVVRLDGADEKIRLVGVNSGEPGSRFTWYLVNGKKVTLRYDFSHTEEFRAYERHAREEGLGLFWRNAKTQMVSPGQDASPEGVFYGGLGGASKPVLIASSRVHPNYPEMARKIGVKGPAVLQIVVQKDGTVGDIGILSSPARELGFDEAAIAAVRQWRFTPALKDGKPVDALWTVVVDFVLQ